MANPYESVSVNDYNANPPPDDGSRVPANQVTWAKHKTKLGDPLKTAIEEIDAALVTAFGKVSGGITEVNDDYTALASDQGKIIVITVAGKTITTPDATVVGTPFKFHVLNVSSGDITVDGSGSQTVDNTASVIVRAGKGLSLDTDGDEWYSIGKQTIDISNGAIVNGTFVCSVAASALTIALKTLAGNDPSAADPVYVPIRNATATSATFQLMAVTSALSIVVPNGATLGTVNSIPFRVWVVLFNESGTARIGVFQSVSGGSISPLCDAALNSAGLIGTGSDSGGTLYSNDAVTSVPMAIIGYADWSTGLATAGAWTDGPTLSHIKTPHTPLPGQTVQVQRAFKSDTATLSTSGSFTDITGLSVSITPTAAPNAVLVETEVNANSSDTVDLNLVRSGTSIGQGDAENSNTRCIAESCAVSANFMVQLGAKHLDYPGVASATTYKIQTRSVSGSTYINRPADTGTGNTRARASSVLFATEIQV